MKTNNSNLHYEFTEEEFCYLGYTLRRIRATKNLPQHKVKKGELGGWIEKETNLQNEAWVYDNAKIYDSARVYDNVRVSGNARVCGSARIYGNVAVFENAIVCGKAEVSENAKVYGNAIVCGNAVVYGESEICGNGKIQNTDDLCSFSYFGSRRLTTTFFRTKDKDIFVVCGCFNGTLEEFVEKVKETHGDNKYAKEYLLMVELVKVKFNL